MKSIEYVKEHIDEFEQDDFFDSRFTNRFIDFLPTEELDKFGYKYTGVEERIPKEWTEENIISQLKEDTIFGYKKQLEKEEFLQN